MHDVIFEHILSYCPIVFWLFLLPCNKMLLARAQIKLGTFRKWFSLTCVDTQIFIGLTRCPYVKPNTKNALFLDAARLGRLDLIEAAYRRRWIIPGVERPRRILTQALGSGHIQIAKFLWNKEEFSPLIPKTWEMVHKRSAYGTKLTELLDEYHVEFTNRDLENILYYNNHEVRDWLLSHNYISSPKPGCYRRLKFCGSWLQRNF